MQLATAYIQLRELPKAEAYARVAIEIAGPHVSIAKLMAVDNPLAAIKAEAAAEDRSAQTSGLSHPRSSYSVKTQAFMMSTACLMLGNVHSARLRHTKAVQAYKRARYALNRLSAPPDSPARHGIAESLSSLHANIGNQYAKEHMPIQAMQEYEAACTLAKEIGDEEQQLRMQTTLARVRIEMGEGSEDDRAREQAGLLELWNLPGQQFGVRDRLAHMAIATAREPAVQRQWLQRVMAMHEERGTTLEPVCSICLEDVRNDTAKLMYTVCKHVFHSDCLHKSKSPEGGLNCPNCRARIATPTSTIGMLREACANG